MAVNGETTLRVLMFGFEEPLASELGEALANEQAVVRTCPPLTAHDGFALIEQANILFCAAEPDYYRPLLAKIKGAKLQLPVVIVGRQPEVSQWLAALEAGADDFCVPPFESSQVRWLLNSAISHGFGHA